MQNTDFFNSTAQKATRLVFSVFRFFDKLPVLLARESAFFSAVNEILRIDYFSFVFMIMVFGSLEEFWHPAA